MNPKVLAEVTGAADKLRALAIESLIAWGDKIRMAENDPNNEERVQEARRAGREAARVAMALSEVLHPELKVR